MFHSFPRFTIFFLKKTVNEFLSALTSTNCSKYFIINYNFDYFIIKFYLEPLSKYII